MCLQVLYTAPTPRQFKAPGMNYGDGKEGKGHSSWQNPKRAAGPYLRINSERPN